MWTGSNVDAPPIVSELWPAIRDRLRADTVEQSLWHKAWPKPAGASRVYVEGDQPETAEDVEDRAWGRVVVVPGDPLEATWTPGLPYPLTFLVRAEVNSHQRTGGYRHDFHLQRILRECFRLLQNWSGPITAVEVAIAQPTRAAVGWKPSMIDDRVASGTFMLSQRYNVDVVEAPTAT